MATVTTTDNEKIGQILDGITRLFAQVDAMDERLSACEADTKARKDAEDKAKAAAAAEPTETTQQFAEAQVKADRVARAFGDDAGAPRWMHGETLSEYRQRNLRKYQRHSPTWRSIDLAKINDAATLAVAETQIYADAFKEASNPTSVEGDELRMITVTDYAGRKIHRFVGSETAAWKPFQNPDRRGRFVKPPANS
jgi:hypothetical protein